MRHWFVISLSCGLRTSWFDIGVDCGHRLDGSSDSATLLENRAVARQRLITAMDKTHKQERSGPEAYLSTVNVTPGRSTTFQKDVVEQDRARCCDRCSTAVTHAQP